MSGHKINPSSPTPLHGIEREGHIDEAAARRVRRKNYDKDDKTRWGSLRKQFREHGSTGFSPKLTEENSFELEHANNDKYQYHPGGKPRQKSPNHDADSGYNEERASPRYHTPDAQGLLARHQQERAGRPGKHVTIKTGKNPTSKDEVWKAEQPEDRMDDGRLIRSPPTSRPASSERRITPVEEVEPTVSSSTGLISAMKPTDGRRRPTPNKDNRPPSSKDPIQPVLHQPARDQGPLPSTSAAFLGSPTEYGKENMPPKAKSPVPPSAQSSVPPSAKSPVPPKIKSPVPPHAPQPTKAPQPVPSTSGTQNIHASKSGQERLPSASKPPQIRTTSPTTKAPTNVAPPKKKEESVPASVKTVDETKKDGSFHDLQRDLAPPKKEAPTSIGKSKKKPSFSEKKYQTTDEPVKTAEVKPLERKLERKDTAQVLKDKDLNMDTEFLDDRNGSGKTLIKDRPAKKKGDWMASKKTQGTSKRHGKKKAVSRKDAHIQELSGTEKACYTCAGYCMCCACCYRLFKDDDDDEVFRRRKCITVFLAIALAIVLVGLIVGLCIGLGGLGGPAPTSPPRFILVPQNLNPIINVNGNQPVSAGTPAGGTGTAAGTANDSATATDGATPGGTTG